MASVVSSGFRPGVAGPSSGVGPAGSTSLMASGTTTPGGGGSSATGGAPGSSAGFTLTSGGLAGIMGTGGFKPVPMKLFATWEVDRTPPNCIPRLCSLTLTRLVLHKPLGAELNSVIIAVKMQSSKRTLRSNEIELPASGLLDTELELTFSLQYPHFLKREGNQLHIMLQRRKKYKNRTILGFKTLAVGIINMSQVLQKQMDLELELYGDIKEKSGSAIGKVYMLSLSSQPVDHEDPGGDRQKGVSEEAGDRVEIYSDDDEEYTSAEEGSDSEPMLDEQQPHPSATRSHLLLAARKGRRPKATSLTAAGAAAAARQRNLKQKFVALLKKFKVTDPEDLDQEQASLDQKLSEGVDPADIEDLFDQLEDFSDSGPEADTISIGSTPKPSLKPFFCSSRNLLHEARSVVAADAAKAQTTDLLANQPTSDHGGVGSDRLSDDSSKEGVSDSHPDTLTDPEFSDPPVVTSSPPQSGDEVRKEREKAGEQRRSRLFSKDKPSAFALKQQKLGTSHNRDRSDRLNAHQTSSIDASNQQPRKVLLEQLSRVLPSDIDTLPDQVILANTCDRQGAHLAAKLADHSYKVVCTAGQADVRAALTCLVAKIQKFCNTKTQSPPLVKVALIGSDTFVNSVLRPYVELFSSKPPDWQGFVKFFIVPLGVNTVSKYIGSHDPNYSTLFLHESWRELLEKAEPGKAEVGELVARVSQYLSSPADNLMQLPVAEAMVTYKEKSSDEESSQVFIPFVSDVRVGSDCLGPGGPQSLDLDDNSTTTGGGQAVGGSSVCGSASLSIGSPPPEGRLTPPSSPHIGVNTFGSMGDSTSSSNMGMNAASVQASQAGGKDRTESFSGAEPVDLQLDFWTVGDAGLGFNTSGLGGLSGSGISGVSSSVSGMSGSSLASVKRQDHTARSDFSSKRGGGSSSEAAGGGAKASIKTSIWFMQVLRLGVANSTGDQPTFSMHYWIKEKKQKTVMRLGKKKEKDKESEMRSVDGIIRLICLSKGQTPLKVHIDGLEWAGVKFFQLSSQWQTHIKYFPVASLLASGTQTSL